MLLFFFVLFALSVHFFMLLLLILVLLKILKQLRSVSMWAGELEARCSVYRHAHSRAEVGRVTAMEVQCFHALDFCFFSIDCQTFQLTGDTRRRRRSLRTRALPQLRAIRVETASCIDFTSTKTAFYIQTLLLALLACRIHCISLFHELLFLARKHTKEKSWHVSQCDEHRAQTQTHTDFTVLIPPIHARLFHVPVWTHCSSLPTERDPLRLLLLLLLQKMLTVVELISN